MANNIVAINGNGHSESKAHFVLVPLFAQGHMIPMVDMACLIADRGAAAAVTVTFVTTPANASRIRPTIERAKLAGLPVHFLELKFPCEEAGLPEGCENIDLVPSFDLFMPFFKALRLLQQPLQAYLEAAKPPPTCIISDNVQWWTMAVARALNVPRLVFHGPSCFFSLCMHNIRVHRLYQNVSDEHEAVTVLNLPHRVTVSKATAPIWLGEPGMEEDREQMNRSEDTADGVVVNSFRELEPEYVELFERTIGRRVWTIGPLSLYHKDADNLSLRGNKASVGEHQVLKWLDAMAPHSVVYVNFGSIVRNRPEQLKEIGHGLEASSHPFIWVTKESELEEMREWMSSGFEERAKERSLMISGWAPQVLILSHPSIGGFVTHCGWNSTIEAISAGVPMATFPHFADQFLNEKLIVDVLRVGVAVGVKEPWTVKVESIIRANRDRVENAVVTLMGGSKEAEERRKRAREFGEMARKAMEEGGSSYENLADLIEFAKGHAK